MAFDPKDFGATLVEPTREFNPDDFGATLVEPTREFNPDDFGAVLVSPPPSFQPQQSLAEKIWSGAISAGRVAGQLGIGFAKEAGKTALGLAKIGGKAVDILSPGQPFAARLGREEDIQKVLEPEGTAQKIGGGIEKVAEFMAPGQVVRAAKATVGGIIGATKLAPALQGAIKILTGAGLEGLSAGFVRTLQTGGDLREAGKTAAIAGAIATPFEALRVLAQPVSAVLEKGAEKKVTQALAPTTLENKRLAEKIVPEMLSRRVKFVSRGGLVSKAEEGMNAAGQQLDDAYHALPSDAKVQIAPMVEKIGKIKQTLIPKGTKVIPDAVNAEYTALQNIQQEIVDVAGGKSAVSVESLRNYRQILDSSIAKAGKGFGLTGKEKASQLATKSMANAIRGELAKEFPDIAKLNAEYNFWSNVKDVTEATILRTKGHGEPIGRQITEVGGAIVGAVLGGLGKAVTGLLSLHFLQAAVTSPAWRNTSGLVRQSIADALAGGNAQRALDILGRLTIGTEEAIR